MLRRIATEERWLVNGSRGLGGIPRPFAGVVDPDTYRYLFLLLAAILVVVAYVLADRGIRSPWGRVLRAIREDEAAAATAGKNVVAFKLQGFVLGAAIMGAGARSTPSSRVRYRRIPSPTSSGRSSSGRC